MQVPFFIITMDTLRSGSVSKIKKSQGPPRPEDFEAEHPDYRQLLWYKKEKFIKKVLPVSGTQGPVWHIVIATFPKISG